jgi:hypothetical protein
VAPVCFCYMDLFENCAFVCIRDGGFGGRGRFARLLFWQPAPDARRRSARGLSCCLGARSTWTMSGSA